MTKRIGFMQEVLVGSNDLSAIAYMNLNKCGGSTVDFHKLKKYVEIPDIREHIREEIALLAPDIVVCCGHRIDELVKGLLSDMPGMPEKIVPMLHPSCWVSHHRYIDEFRKRWNASACKKRAERSKDSPRQIVSTQTQ